MVIEHFEVLNEKERKLVGVIETEQPRRRQPVAILLNGFLDTMESLHIKKLAEMLRKEGFVTARFDYTYGFGSGTGDQANFTVGNQVEDATRVLEHVTRRGYVKPEKALLLGHCFGGMAALLLSAFDERVAGVVTISTPYHFHDTKLTRLGEHEMARMRLKRYFHLESEGKEVRINYAFFEDGVHKDMARATRNLRQPILVIHGRQDESIPVANAQEIYDRVPEPKELLILESMGHHPTEKHLKEMFPAIRQFLKKKMKA